MKKSYLKIFSLIFVVLLLGVIFLPAKAPIVYAVNQESNCKSYVLIEKNTHNILEEKNAHDKLPIASVTKLMTTFLTLEKIEKNEIKLEDKIVVSENASGMGGSQIFLDENCEYELKELLKSVIVASANDSSVALAEYIAGSENNFVKMMNEKAIELNMMDTHYANCTGLPSNDGYSSAYDQAILLSHVQKYDIYHQYSSIWLEDFVHPSGRKTCMTNTNKLSKFYQGCTGGKTGSTNQAKYCLAVGAKRNGMELISVVLGADSSQDRFKLASDLLNFGFANFKSKTLFSNADLADKTIKIKGLDKHAELKAEKEFSIVCKLNEEINYTLNYNLPNSLTEVKENEHVGNVEIYLDGVLVDTINILSCSTIKGATIWDYFKEITKN